MAGLLEAWGGTLVVQVSSSAPSADPVWVDISERVKTAREWLSGQGRQTELDRGDDGRWTLALNNRDGVLTWGNPSSPYAPWWGLGQRIRGREVIGARAFPLFDGYIEMPTLEAVTQAVGDVDSDLTVALAVVDRLGWIRSGRRMVSTLAEHIISAGGSTLVGYWPYSEAMPPFRDPRNNLPGVSQAYGDSYGSVVATSGTSRVQGAASAVAADDLSVAALTASLGVSGSGAAIATSPDMRVDLSTSGLTLATGQVATLVAWYYADLPADQTSTLMQLTMDDAPAVVVGATGVVTARNALGSMLGSVDGVNMPSRAWTPVAVRFGFNPATLELWLGRNRYVGSVAGAPISPQTISEIICPGSYQGGVGHLQLYVGAASDWGYTEYLAQDAMARTCLEGQLTGGRITTLAGYAGIPAGLLDVDPGTVRMQRAALAGSTPADAMETARSTELGRLYMSGDGRLTFADRHTIYNV